MENEVFLTFVYIYIILEFFLLLCAEVAGTLLLQASKFPLELFIFSLPSSDKVLNDESHTPHPPTSFVTCLWHC